MLTQMAATPKQKPAQAAGPAIPSKREALALRLTAFFAPRVAEMGLDLLQLRLLGHHRSGQRLDVRIDRRPGQGAVRLNDCRRVSRLLSAQLDAFDAEGNAELRIDGAYELEVSSPGMDRILRDSVDFQRFQGLTCKLVTRRDGVQESVGGVIERCEAGYVHLAQTRKRPTRVIALADVVQANLDPTFAEWLALGQRLKAESAALGESDSVNDADADEEEAHAAENAEDDAAIDESPSF